MINKTHIQAIEQKKWKEVSAYINRYMYYITETNWKT